MVGDPPTEAYLEVDPAPTPGAVAREPAVTRVAGSMEAWLESDSTTADPPPSEVPSTDAPRRRKVRAEDRAVPEDTVSIALLASLSTEGPLLCALWPDVSPADLLRAPPPPEAIAARCDYALRALDAVGRRDAAARARADVAQRMLHERLDHAKAKGDPREVALDELLRVQTDDLLEAARLLAGDGKVLYAADAARLDDAAEARGIDPVRAREAVVAKGYSVLATEAREWAACDALPGAPTTMDAAALILLLHPAQGADAVRSGVVLAWLRANGAAPEVIARARDARLAAERQGAGGDSLAVHSQAWALGRRDLVVGGTTLRSPGEIAAAVRAGTATLDDLARSARDGVLAAWLRMQGWVSAAGAADLVARGEPTGMKRLAWALGEALVLGDRGFTDPGALARAVLATPSLREALVAEYVSGDLLAWLESLSPALRDEQWIERLRRAQTAPWGATGDQLPLWWGVYAQARSNSLTLTADDGHPVTFTTTEPLRVTVEVSAVWDALKRAYASGELIAWMGVVAPDDPIHGHPRPPRDLDAELNGLLWDLGHPGMVMEWGGRDHPVSSPSDLVRAYQSSWQLLEAQIAKGYVLDWLARFHGSRPAASVHLRDLVEALRGEIGKVPSGYLALKTALLCGMDYLPLDPCQPGDRANFRGYVGVQIEPVTVTSPEAWAPLAAHLQSGSALVWLALLPGVRPQLAQSMLLGAFQTGHQDPEHLQRMMVGVSRAFGAPRPSPVLQAELSVALSRGAGVGGTAGANTATLQRWRWAVAELIALFAVLCFAAWMHLHVTEDRDVPGPAPTDGTEVLVRLDVRVRPIQDLTAHGALPRGNRPTLRALIQTRDEPIHLGPCDPRSLCQGVYEGVRLSPGVPFKMVVTDEHTLWHTRLGATWLQWRGNAHEEAHATLGTVRVDIRITRLFAAPMAAPPAAASTPSPSPRPIALPIGADGGPRRWSPRRGRSPVQRRMLGTPYTSAPDPME